MRTIRKISLIAALALGCAAGAYFFGRDAFYKPLDPFAQQIQKEIRKHDSWVEREIEQDYTNGGRKGFAQILRESPSSLKKMENSGFGGFEAQYDKKYDILTLPDIPDEQKRKHTLDGIDHELWHCLYDDSDSKGIIHRPEYSGPSLDEIVRFCEQMANGKEFDSLKAELQREAAAAPLNLILKKAKRHFDFHELSKLCFEQITGYIQESGILKMLEKDKRSSLKEPYENAESKLKEFGLAAKEFREGLTLYGKGSKPVEKLTLDQLQNLQGYYSSLYGKLEKAMKAFGEVLTPLYIELEHLEASVLEQIKDYKERLSKDPYSQERQKLEDELRSIEQSIESQKTRMSEIKKIYLLIYTFCSDTEMDEVISSATFESKSNVEYIRNILRPNEFMARIIDSLYSVYYGPVTQLKFPLREQDLVFLERFSYKGKPLFRKGIEKYRVGLQMIADGMSPADVKRQLEYATHFEYKRREYNWPEAKFRIRGEIPVLVK